MKTIVQDLKKVCKDEYCIAERYYSLLSAFNDMRLTEREIQLISYTAIHGDMSYIGHREGFCEKYSTSLPTINNIIAKLKKMGVLIKDKNKRIRVAPVILLNFKDEIVLRIKLEHGE